MLAVGFGGAAILTFVAATLAVLPRGLVERYAHSAFPKISALFRILADNVPFAWIDAVVSTAVLFVIYSLIRRRWLNLIIGVSIGYLLFFWSWGVNYHRVPLATKLVIDPASNTPEAIRAFSIAVAHEINATYLIQKTPYDDSAIQREVANRVAFVVERLDGVSWLAPSRPKTSILFNRWMRVAGIDGFFDPIVHEAIVNDRVLDIERPFVIAHELAHVRGYPEEGDANFIALMATALSDNPRLRYSGWLTLWLYLRSRAGDALLEAGPREDIQRIYARERADRITLISNIQSATFDLFLKANNVPQGVRSYSRIVILAAGTRPTWDRFR